MDGIKKVIIAGVLIALVATSAFLVLSQPKQSATDTSNIPAAYVDAFGVTVFYTLNETPMKTDIVYAYQWDTFNFYGYPGYQQWSNVAAGIGPPDGIYVTCIGTVNKTVNSEYTAALFKGFNVPLSAIITGIQLQVLHHGYQARDHVVSFGWGDGYSFSINKASSLTWSNSDTWVYYGGANDVWGTDITPYQLVSTDTNNFEIYLGVTLGA